MTTSQAMFLLAAEEMNISRAAERASVTQQCASDHIRKLEQEYGLPLFERRPKLKLTEAGELLLRTLRQTERLEYRMEEQFHEMKGETSGHITIGMNPTRARIILPELLSDYRSLFPRVSVSCVLGDTAELEEMLLKNKLDLFLGIDTARHQSFLRRELGSDHIFFLASESLCHQCIPSKSIEVLKTTGISLADLYVFPITRNLTASTLNRLINHSLDFHNTSLKSSYFISDYDTQIAMCGNSLSAAFCPSLILKRVLEYNGNHPRNQQVHIFPVTGMTNYLRIDLVTHNDISQPKFISKFMELLTVHVQGLYRDLEPFNSF